MLTMVMQAGKVQNFNHPTGTPRASKRPREDSNNHLDTVSSPAKKDYTRTETPLVSKADQGIEVQPADEPREATLIKKTTKKPPKVNNKKTPCKISKKRQQEEN